MQLRDWVHKVKYLHQFTVTISMGDSIYDLLNYKFHLMVRRGDWLCLRCSGTVQSSLNPEFFLPDLAGCQPSWGSSRCSLSLCLSFSLSLCESDLAFQFAFGLFESSHQSTCVMALKLVLCFPCVSISLFKPGIGWSDQKWTAPKPNITWFFYTHSVSSFILFSVSVLDESQRSSWLWLQL